MRRIAYLTGLLLVSASPSLAQTPPTLDYRHACKQTPRAGMDRKATIKSCLDDEAQAKKQLPPVWRGADGASRRMCLAETTQGGLPSYVELIVCLQNAAAVKAQ